MEDSRKRYSFYSRKIKKTSRRRNYLNGLRKMGRHLPNRQGIGIFWERRYSRTGEGTAVGRRGSIPGAEQAQEGAVVRLGLTKLDYQGVLLYA